MVLHLIAIFFPFIFMTEIQNINKSIKFTYCIKNKFADGDQYIYFIADPPHLIKTALIAFFILLQVKEDICGILITTFCGITYLISFIKI